MGATHGSPGELGRLLRHWRRVRGASQLRLSLDSGVSQRHISFAENGRSRPSAGTVVALAEALDVPLRDRNALLVAAGHAPAYSAQPWDAAEMDGVTRALRRMLGQHEPFPALVLDRDWTVLMANDAAPRFFGRFVDLDARPKPRNLLHLVFDPGGLRPFIADWDRAARSLIQRVHRESVGGVAGGRSLALVAELLAYPGVEPSWAGPAAAAAALPVVPIGFIYGGHVLNYFSMVATVGTPQTLAAQELRLECLFPADPDTERQHLDWAATGG